MKIGVPREIMSSENRVGMTPAVVLSMTNAGHEVFVETKAGKGSGFTDAEYAEAGATITVTAKEAWNQEMIMKVKDPLPEEFHYFRSEEHTSELQSRGHLVCRLLLEKKKNNAERYSVHK